MVKEVRGFITIQDVKKLNKGEEVFIYNGKSVKLYLKLCKDKDNNVIIEINADGDD